MSYLKSIIPIVIMLFCSISSKSQDNNNSIKDTTIIYTDSVEARSMEMETAAGENEEQDDYASDTTLVNNQLLVDADSVKVLKNSKSFAYAKNLDSLLYAYQQTLEKTETGVSENVSWLDRFFLSPVTTWFFWILAGVFISFVLYKLFFTQGFFQRSYANTNVTELPDEKENLSKTADYGKLIAGAVGNKNYRLAVRYHYLQTLQKLSSKNLIQFASDKTNYQYVNELAGKPYKKAFASLTLNYEYVWYGAFEIDENIFIAIQNQFKQFNLEA